MSSASSQGTPTDAKIGAVSDDKYSAKPLTLNRVTHTKTADKNGKTLTASRNPLSAPLAKPSNDAFLLNNEIVSSITTNPGMM